MNPELKEKLTNSSVWIRFIYNVFYLIVLYLLWWVVLFGAAAQFLFILFKDEPNRDLKNFLSSLSLYLGNVAKFITFSIDEKPFPFRSWEDDSKEIVVKL